MYGTSIVFSVLICVLQKYPWLLVIPTHTYGPPALWRVSLNTGALLMRQISYLVYRSLSRMISSDRHHQSSSPGKKSQHDITEPEREPEVNPMPDIHPTDTGEYVLFSVHDINDDYEDYVEIKRLTYEP